MSRNMYNPLVLILIGLAVLGFFYRLITQPMQLLTQIAIFGAIAAILFLLYKRFLAKQFGVAGTPHRPKQQVKNKMIKKSTNVVPHRKKAGPKKTSNRTLNKKSSAPNLTVIEGKKGKKKNRALF